MEMWMGRNAGEETTESQEMSNRRRRRRSSEGFSKGRGGFRRSMPTGAGRMRSITEGWRDDIEEDVWRAGSVDSTTLKRMMLVELKELHLPTNIFAKAEKYF